MLQRTFRRRIGAIVLVTILALVVTACARPAENPAPGAQPGAQLSGTIRIDGSSTVFPITEAVAEEFQNLHSGVQVPVGVSGTGGGFKKFAAGEIDISNASRQIKSSEADAARQNGIEYVELPVAYDGLSVMVNPANDFVTCLTVDELKQIWEPGSTVTHWNQVRPEWPNAEIKLYGPGTDSGTFDYFTEVITGESKASRPDYTASEDDNVLVTGISGDQYALGYFGYAYYVENQDKLKLVAVDGGNGCVTPSETTINDGSYAPLSRPIYIYVSQQALGRPEVKEFVQFYLTEGPSLVSEVGYIPLPQSTYAEGLQKIGK